MDFNPWRTLCSQTEPLRYIYSGRSCTLNSRSPQLSLEKIWLLMAATHHNAPRVATIWWRVVLIKSCDLYPKARDIGARFRFPKTLKTMKTPGLNTFVWFATKPNATPNILRSLIFFLCHWVHNGHLLLITGSLDLNLGKLILRINVSKGHSRSQIKKRNGKTMNKKLSNLCGLYKSLFLDWFPVLKTPLPALI